MTFKSVPIDSVLVDRESRQRKEITGTKELAESIRRSGLINPIVIDENNVLIAGERRLTACRSLGWTHIPAQYFSDLSPIAKHLVELEENTKRLDLPWQEQCQAILRYHELRSAEEEDWTYTKTGEALGINIATVTQHISVAKELLNGNEKVAEAPKFSTARGIVARKAEREKSSVLESIAEAPKRSSYPILLKDFTEWAYDKQDKKFNLVHCDFPYGIHADRKKTFQSNKSFESYADSPDIYWHLLEILVNTQDNWVAESAHLIFWFPMTHYIDTVSLLAGAGWAVQPHPLVWLKATGGGICPDPQRTPTRAYETALFASRGDRPIVRTVRNAISEANTKETHQSEKPQPMLRHFLRMVVDEYSWVIDPTAGSGNALKVAKELGAYYVLGLESNKEIWKQVKESWDD